MEKRCLICGNLFTKKENVSLREWNNITKFCSKICANKWKTGKPSSSTTKFKKGHSTWNKGLRGYRAGALNNKWKGGITSENEKFKKSPEYKEWRINILKRDWFACQECGHQRTGLHAHHIKPFADYPEVRLELYNGITLCKDCHRKKHPNMNFVHIQMPEMATIEA